MPARKIGGPNRAGHEHTTMGVRFHGDSAWVRHQDKRGVLTEYDVAPREPGRDDYLPEDYDVRLKIGPDALDHGEVRELAHIAFCDAYGSL
jgi:hypothetical protein